MELGGNLSCSERAVRELFLGAEHISAPHFPLSLGRPVSCPGLHAARVPAVGELPTWHLNSGADATHLAEDYHVVESPPLLLTCRAGIASIGEELMGGSWDLRAQQSIVWRRTLAGHSSSPTAAVASVPGERGIRECCQVFLPVSKYCSGS